MVCINEKPPIGLKPRKLHEQGRVIDILAAMERYVKVGRVPPFEWRIELDDLFNSLEKQ